MDKHKKDKDLMTKFEIEDLQHCIDKLNEAINYLHVLQDTELVIQIYGSRKILTTSKANDIIELLKKSVLNYQKRIDNCI